MSGVAFAAGVVVGAQHVGSDERVAREFAAAWQRGDAAAMYATLSDDARRRIGPVAFARAYRQAAITATQVSLAVGRTRGAGGHHVAFPVRVATRIFGTVRARVSLPIVQSGGSRRVDWGPYLVFPGLRPGERLTRQTVLPRRASILARDGTPLAQGDQRTSPLGPAASEIVGTLGAPSPDRVDRLRAAGFPPDAEVGVSGLERLFDGRLSGTPGGVLLAGDRPLARGHSRPDPPLKTSIDAGVQAAATEALAGRYGGVAALRPRTGEILAPRRHRLLRAPAAGLHVQDRHRRRRAAERPRQADDHLPLPDLDAPGGRRAPERQRRELRRQLRAGLRAVVQLGVRAARAPSWAPAGWWPPPSASVSTAAAAPGRRRQHDPRCREIGDDLAVGSSAIGQGARPGDRARDGGGGRHDRRRTAGGPRHAAARAAGPCARGRPARGSRDTRRAPDGGHRRASAPAPRPPSPASRWRARPVPPSCARPSRPRPAGRRARHARRHAAKPDPTDTDAWFARLRARARTRAGGVRPARARRARAGTRRRRRRARCCRPA